MPELASRPGGTPPPAAGQALFARYAFPPNELGYCGPADEGSGLLSGERVASVARKFDGAWPYLEVIAAAAGIDDPLDLAVVRSYWIGGGLLDTVDGGGLIRHLRTAFARQVTGLLGVVDADASALAHHSFHVFVVYPWVRFLRKDPVTPLRILQNCRIRWGTVEAVDDEHVLMRSPQLTLDSGGRLTPGDPCTERVRWSRSGRSLTGTPAVGDTVAAHWDWVCGSLTEADCVALQQATQQTLDLVNGTRAPL
ncbi:hypothetical protein JDV09_11460 [Mycobacterium sp. Y57]|uniref:DUF6390 family protein n=1 Tax=Mycolicibacterium xanthum TaxID=2796469 RepID=UPI001C84FF6F|nr:DUF6390 family protein [Mycolicibacterium xanthum]MBX7432716.1 hypothetical protein [Mycolicibacterium xanthum]